MMSVREIDRSLEQWQMEVKDLRRRKQSGGAGEGGQLPGQADQPERRGQAPLPHGPAIKGRIPPARLPARSPTSGKCTSHLGFGLDALWRNRKTLYVQSIETT